MKTTSNDAGLPLPLKIAAAGLAGCTADLATFPLDTIKVWLQVRGESAATATPSDQLKKASARKVPSIKVRQSILGEHAANRISAMVSTKKTLKTDTSAAAQKAAHLPKTTATVKTLVDTTATRAIKSRSAATFGVNDLIASQLYKAKLSLPKKSVRTGNGGLQTILANVRQGGVRCLYSGLGAGLQRQIGFCSVRIGFYDNVKKFYVDHLPGSPNGSMIVHRILAGGTTGIMAVCLFQPTEVVKIRMQAEKGRYKGSLQAYRHVFKTGGIAEAWKGVGANCARTAVVNICELVTYDMVKETILSRNLMTDNLPCHFASALISGFITTVVASPVDVVKTRYMNSEQGTYKNPIQCAARMFRSEGFKSFYKGFVPSYLRLGSWNIVMFVSYEQYKKFFRDVVTSTPEFPAPHRGNAAPLIPVVDERVIETTYPSYFEAFYSSHHGETGPIS